MKIKIWQIIILVVIIFCAWFGWNKYKIATTKKETIKIIFPYRGDIKTIITTTGTVLPKNRLEIKPPVNGRIEKVLVQEGQKIKVGDTLVWMSSTDRAALLDAARGQGEDKLKEWQDVYKPIPLISPIDGEVIVGTIQSGQAVTTVDPVVVLSDRLIVRAQVDETDIGKIKKNQAAVISLDAYPDAKISANVDHIYYESKTVNNVTIYDVDLLITEIPLFFRSGMNANIDFVIESKEDVLILPLTVVNKNRDGASVWISAGLNEKFVSRNVVLGLSDDRNVEILSGVSQADEIISTTKKYSLPQNNSGSNPLMPFRRKK